MRRDGLSDEAGSGPFGQPTEEVAVDECDRMTLTGIRAWGHHGVLAEERECGQAFVVDAELELDLAPAAASGDLAATVHYGELAGALAAAVERDPVDLIETLAQRLCEVCLAHRPVRRVRLTVHKPAAPLPVPFDDVSVTLIRSAEQ